MGDTGLPRNRHGGPRRTRCGARTVGSVPAAWPCPGALGGVGEPAPRGRAPSGQGQVRGSAQPPATPSSLGRSPESPWKRDLHSPIQAGALPGTPRLRSAPPVLGGVQVATGGRDRPAVRWPGRHRGGGLPTGAEGDLGTIPFPLTPSENCQRRGARGAPHKTQGEVPGPGSIHRPQSPAPSLQDPGLDLPQRPVFLPLCHNRHQGHQGPSHWAPGPPGS